MKVLLSKRDKETKVEVVKYDDKSLTYLVRFLNGKKEGESIVYSAGTIKRWWQEIEDTSDNGSEMVLQPKSEIPKKESSKKKNKKADRTEDIQCIEAMLRKEFDVRTYASMKNYFVLRRKGEKKAFAEVRCGRRVQISVKEVSDYIRENLIYKEGYKYFLPVHVWLEYSADTKDTILKVLN